MIGSSLGESGHYIRPAGHGPGVNQQWMDDGTEGQEVTLKIYGSQRPRGIF